MNSKKKRYMEYHNEKDKRIEEFMNIQSSYVDKGLIQSNERKINWFFSHNKSLGKKKGRMK